MKFISIDELCESVVGKTCVSMDFEGRHVQRIEDYSNGEFTISMLFQGRVIHTYKLSQDDFLSMFEGQEFCD